MRPPRAPGGTVQRRASCEYPLPVLDRPTPVAPPLRTTQVMVVCLAGGVALLTAVALALAPLSETGVMASGVLLPILGVLAVGEIPVYQVLRRRALRRLADRREGALMEARTERVPHELFTLILVGAALAEGVGLFGAVVYLLTANALAIAGPFVALVVLGYQVPTRDRLEDLVDPPEDPDGLP